MCRIRSLVVIQLRVGGEPVSLLSCSYCDRRWWQGIDGLVALGSVLGLAAAASGGSASRASGAG